MSLQQAADSLLRDPTAAAEKLRLVDDYIAHRARAGRRFILPEEHAELEPLIEQYHNDFPRFVKFIRELRDTVQPRSSAYVALHELYRTLDVRFVQQQRRDRAKRAVIAYEKRHPKANYEDRMRWLRRMEQLWGRRRLVKLEEYRRKTAVGRLSTEEREEILRKFWAEIDREIDEGKFG